MTQRGELVMFLFKAGRSIRCIRTPASASVAFFCQGCLCAGESAGLRERTHRSTEEAQAGRGLAPRSARCFHAVDGRYTWVDALHVLARSLQINANSLVRCAGNVNGSFCRNTGLVSTFCSCNFIFGLPPACARVSAANVINIDFFLWKVARPVVSEREFTENRFRHTRLRHTCSRLSCAMTATWRSGNLFRTWWSPRMYNFTVFCALFQLTSSITPLPSGLAAIASLRTTCISSSSFALTNQ